MTDGFTTRVAKAVAATGPLCAGIDPSADLLGAWGLADDPDGLAAFGRTCVEAFAGVVPVVKPQVAFFERMGSAGLAALEEVLAAARRAGLVVIADAKRGDIGSTMAAYASAWLDPASPLVADAMTAMPYMGLGALRPALDLAAAGGRGVIVVTRSSNPEGRSLQTATTSAGSDRGGPAAVRDRRPQPRRPAGPGLRRRGHRRHADALGLRPGGPRRGGAGPGLRGPGRDDRHGPGAVRGCAPGTVLPSASRSLLAAGPDVAALRAAATAECDALRRALD